MPSCAPGLPELVVELLGKPTFRAGQEWRWGRKGSLSVVVGGARAGMWFDHEEADGGWFSDLVGRDLGMAREDADDWIADRIGMDARHRPAQQRSDLTGNARADDPGEPLSRPTDTESAETSPDDDAAPHEPQRTMPPPAPRGSGPPPALRPPTIPISIAKQAEPLALRMDAAPTACRAASRHRRPDPQCRDHRAGRRQALPRRRRQARAFLRSWGRSPRRSPIHPGRC